jgi:serine/threonine-protein kinase
MIAPQAHCTGGDTVDQFVGRSLGPYLIQSRLGAGGMGVVYRAVHQTLGQTRAIKILPPMLAHDETFVRRFQREATIAANVHHPSVVQIYDVRQEDGYFYIVMELVEGVALNDLIRQQGPLPGPRVVDLLGQLADALDFMRAHGVLHRDVKPANVLVRPGNQVTLVDFGIARGASTSAVSLTHGAIGTPAYMAPEIWQGESATPAVDAYALGIMAFEMLTGRLPFSGANTPAFMHAHLYAAVPSPRSVVPHLPVAVETVFARQLAKQPHERYATARGFVTALEQALRTPVAYRDIRDTGSAVPLAPIPTTSSAIAPHPPVSTPAPHGRSIAPVLAVTALVVVALMVTGAYLVAQGLDGGRPVGNQPEPSSSPPPTDQAAGAPVAVAIGSTPSSPPATSTATPASPAATGDREVLRARIDDAERRWSAQGMSSYQIVVRYMNSTWLLQWQTIMVRDGQVVDETARCLATPAGPNPCQVQPFDPPRSTVPGLFAKARSLVEREPPEAIKLTFDETYGFPQAIVLNLPNVVHGDLNWRVESFTIPDSTTASPVPQTSASETPTATPVPVSPLNLEVAKWRRDLASARPWGDGGQPALAFPKTLLLPDRGDDAFKGLSLKDATFYPEQQGARWASYKIRLKLDGATLEDSGLEAAGTIGRSEFDRAVSPDQFYVIGSCDRETYCRLLTSARVGSPPPNAELFRSLKVSGKPAVVHHGVCCNGESWTVIWFDEPENVSYSLSWYLELATRIGAENKIDSSNRRFADELVRAAERTVAVQGP